MVSCTACAYYWSGQLSLARYALSSPVSKCTDCADPDMPLRLWSALDRLEQSELLGPYLGPKYPAAYAAIKRAEFEAFLAEILPREYDWCV